MYTHPDLVQDRHDNLIRAAGPAAPGSLARGAAAALGALIAGRAGLVAIPAGLGLWMFTGFGMAAAVAGAATGLGVAIKR